MKLVPSLIAALVATHAFTAQADVVTDWNLKTHELIGEAKIGTPPAIRVVALVQSATLRAALNAQRAGTAPGAVDAAIAAANRAMLAKLLPTQQAAIDKAYDSAIAAIADSTAKAAGIAAGEQAAAELLAQRAADNVATPETYRPHASAGVYVPTATPAVTQWPQRKPWVMASASQMRPGAPTALTSESWTRDFDEVKAFGGKASTQRSAEQTDVARFWDYSLPAIYYGVVRSVAEQPGRDVLRNARLYATVAQAMDDSLIAVFDAKYHYNFWRPSTAIRNADVDGNAATERDGGWQPLIDTPMHPEFPSAHSALAASVGAVLKVEIGGTRLPMLATSSPTAKGAQRRWSDLDAFVQEVSDARVWGGVHYRYSTRVGAAMGQRIGEMAATSLVGPVQQAVGEPQRVAANAGRE